MFGRFFAVLGSVLLLIVVAFFGATTVVARGPSKAARDLYVNTVMETSAAKFLARMYFSEDEISKIIAENTKQPVTKPSNSTSISIPTSESGFDINGITVDDVKGSTYVGKMMIVNDPSRLFVGTLDAYTSNGKGKQLIDMINDNNAVAGINAGGFYDPGGVGSGGLPLGIVIHGGQLVYGYGTTTSSVIGFDSQFKLVVGDMSAQEALDRGVQEAVSFGPALVIDGARVPISGTGGGLNPRTAIGQRADGSVLLLVIDGRQAQSLGATYQDLADIMVEYGAVNAANLDGGSSTMLIYNGETLNHLSIIGERYLPTSFLVSQPKGGN